MKFFTTIALLIFSTIIALSQLVISPELNIPETLTCGTKADSNYWNYLDSTRELREGTDLQTFRPPAEGLPVVFHVLILEDTDLTQLFSESDADAAVTHLNGDFLQTGLFFRRCLSVNYISAVQDYPGIFNSGISDIDEQERAIIADDNNIGGIINIYVSNRISSSNSNCGFTFTGEDFALKSIFVEADLTETSCLTHHMGHYFNLLHTYHGNTPSDQDANTPEFVARPLDGGNNCPVGEDCNCGPGVGDELCDTPADPEGLPLPNGTYSIVNCSTTSMQSPPCVFWNNFPAGCDIEDDVVGVFPSSTYTPDHLNFMSNGYISCVNRFSPQQIDRMRVSLMVDHNELIDNNVDSNGCFSCPSTMYLTESHLNETVLEYEVSDNITSYAILSPEQMNNDGTIAAGANVTYDAGRFICLNPGFNASYTSNFLAVIDGCAGEYKTATVLIEQQSLLDLSTQPNPFKGKCTIAFNLVESESVTISVADMMGKNKLSLAENKPMQRGKQQIVFDGSNLPAGIYYCTIQAGDKIETRKMVHTK